MMIIVGLTERTGVFTYWRCGWRSSRADARCGSLPARRGDRPAVRVPGQPDCDPAGRPDHARCSPICCGSRRFRSCWSRSIASNIGGTATLIGDPPNIMIGSHVTELTFFDFIVNLAPVALLTLVVSTAIMYLRLPQPPLDLARPRGRGVAQLDPARDIASGRTSSARSLSCSGRSWLLPPRAAPYRTGRGRRSRAPTVLLLVAADDVEDALERVEWSTIFFFIGLFVMVGGLELAGIVRRSPACSRDVTDGSRTAEAMVILWGAAAGSALVDNIPFTAAMIPVVDELQAGQHFDDANWWALALGACFGGNATIVAAAANVTATGILERTGQPISFARFLAIGLPVTLVSFTIATGYLLLFQL